MRVLASGLTTAQTTEIAAFLSQQGVNYKLSDRDTTVLVPEGQLYSLRNVLSEQELLGDGSVGFELWKPPAWGILHLKNKRLTIAPWLVN